jgi:hypothetical protein
LIEDLASIPLRVVQRQSDTKLRSDIVAGLLGSSYFSWIKDDFLERNLA